MRRGAFAVLATLSLFLLGTGLAGPAAAGGPTSILLVSPEDGRTASLYNSDPDYQRLAILMDAFNNVSGSTTPPEGGTDSGPAGSLTASDAGVTVTWLMHDISVWRVDRIFLTADGGPWIATQSSLDGGTVGSERPTWHRATSGPELTDLLNRLNVGTVGKGTTSDTPAASTPAASAAASAPAASTPADQTTRTSGSDRWIWGSAGLALGLLLGTGLTLSAPRARKWRTTNQPTDADPSTEPSTRPGTEPSTGPSTEPGTGPHTETLSVGL